MAPSRGPEAVPRHLHTTLSGHKGPVNVARYAKGAGKYILTGGQDRTVKLWNANLGSEIKTFATHGYEVLSVSVSVTVDVSYGQCNNDAAASGRMIMLNLRPLAETVLYSSGMLRLLLPPGDSQVIWGRYTS
jgi:WD40 repeat protein